MKLALIGYGKMGKMIEKMAQARGHEVVARIDIDNRADLTGDSFKSADVAIEFTSPQSAVNNVKACFSAGVPVVCGTTGWQERLEEVKEDMKAKEGALCWSSNYSVGVNIFFAISAYAAKIMNDFNIYDVEMTETHHIHKLDAPSGTAISIAEGIIKHLDRKNHWSLDKADAADSIAIHAIREGEVPGIHTVRYESAVDSITLTHDAKSREGFAMGAVIAAEFLAGKKGFYTTADVFKFAEQ